ncbi:CAP domain-containing protein [Corynebacterium sp. zg-331]|nr:CAP domain-containing protein [Corynebacterium sp. zg-331]MPV52214.1 CAP domain-containing protein [Corynebacterium sp. zg331]
MAVGTIMASALITFSAQTAHAHDCSDEYVVNIVKLTNEQRVAKGLSPLECDEELTRQSHEWAEHMRQTGEFEHAEGDFAENIAWNSRRASADAIVENWVKSPAHRNNILDAGAALIGVGWSYSEKVGAYVVQRFL